MTNQTTADFLVEIHTEELPPTSLKKLALNFLAEIEARFKKENIVYSRATYFATPRRIAVIATGVYDYQPDTQIERRGPAKQAAFDAVGNPTPACAGFAKSCGVTPADLAMIKTAQGEWVGYLQTVTGKPVISLLPGIVEEALTALPISKRMRWGNHAVEFVRPISSVIMLYGSEVIDATIMGFKAGRITQGHRSHATKDISIAKPSEYVETLQKQGFVIADFEQRKEIIRQQAQELTQQTVGRHAKLMMNEDLLDEVTNLVEWPVAVLGDFDPSFLDVPAEALISAMEDHQRYFAMTDEHNKLLPHFVTITNIQSNDMQRVIAGNERVLRARLSDAAFFYKTDKKIRLDARVKQLSQVVFQAQLGTLHDKAKRIELLSQYIATSLNQPTELAARAGLLAKADLTTEMVGEFPELQGIAGYYYALHDGENNGVAVAIKEHYLPKFSGDVLPSSLLGSIVALSDRLDTLVGIFGIQGAPTGDKDPFALRRAGLGVLRIVIEHELDLDLKLLLIEAINHYAVSFKHPSVLEDVLHFLWERLKPWYADQGMTPDIFASVAGLNLSKPYDFHRRMLAVSAFKKLPEAEFLSIANKRVTNLLAKLEKPLCLTSVNESLFELPAERVLHAEIMHQEMKLKELAIHADYSAMLLQLASLRKPVDDYFENVMIMVEDSALRENRLVMLRQLRNLFLQVADVALLVSEK
jgi:glycyl-tRNA synthetase beta chain